MKTEIKVVCCVCNKHFTRYESEVKRSQRLGRRIYCSRQCCGKDNFCNIPTDVRPAVRKGIGINANEFSPFRHHLHRMICHSKVRGSQCAVKVTLQDLKLQWDKQKGICPYTGWHLRNRQVSNERIGHQPESASVDRIDSSEPYTPDNIQFVACIANYAKSDFPEQELLDFCKAVYEHWYGNVHVKNNPRNTDDLSKFRSHWYRMKQSSRNSRNNKRKCVNVTLSDLKEQWNKQNGMCPYSGWSLLDYRYNRKEQTARTPNRASLDRIDSSKGYTLDNIQFVSYMANLAKNSYPESTLLDFCKAVYEHRINESVA